MLDVFYSEGGNYPHSTNLSMEDYWHFVIQFNFSKCIQVPQSLLDFFSIWPCCTTISKDMKNAPPHLPCAEYILLQCMFSKEKGHASVLPRGGMATQKGELYSE